MKVTPRTSFVIPAHNAGRTLAQTLDSVLAQSDADWEALVVDDASSDDTAQVSAAYAARDPRFVALRGSGGEGASGARNVGLQAARGRWLVFLDSDDWLAPAFLRRMHAARRSAGDGAVLYCDYCRVAADGTHAAPSRNPEVEEAPFRSFSSSCPVAIHAVLIERERVLRVGGFDTSLRTCEDWDLWQRVARSGTKWVRVPEVMAFYRIRDHSLSHDRRGLMRDSQVVIGRAYRPDPRVPDADPAHAAGLAPGSGPTLDEAIAYLALWCFACDPGQAENPAELRRLLAPLPADAEQADGVAITMLDGLMSGLRLEPGQLIARWAEIGPQVDERFRELAAMWGDTLAARRAQYAFERQLLSVSDLTEPRTLSLTLGCRIDLRNPPTIAVPDGIDRVFARIYFGAQRLGTVQAGALGAIAPRQWFELAARQLKWQAVSALAAVTGARALLSRRAPQTARAARRWLRRPLLRRARWRDLAFAAGRDVLLAAAPPAGQPDGHVLALAALQRESAVRHDLAPRAHVALAGAADETHETAAATRRDYWERLFAKPDPWNYGSAYEQEKYAYQLAMLPPGPIEHVLELACAEGRFTEQLAARAQRVVAADISSTALQRAAERCSSHRNIEFLQLDLAAQAFPAGADAVFCSEVLYYLDETELRQVARKMADAVRPGGRIVSAHAYVLGDDRTRTGFDWGHPWGALTIARTFADVPTLKLERSVRTELYQVDCFLRCEDPAAAPPPRVETRSMRAELDPDVGRFVVWDGAVALRSEVAVDWAVRVPVLAYHRIAEDGPAGLARYRVAPAAFEAQMRWLRRHGYHAVVADELASFFEQGQALRGRPVMITFDDGYEDFAEAAFPVLRRHDLRADVFVVSALVGGHAEWDRALGEPAALMNAATISALAAQGVRFGSHLATHRGADGLPTLDLARELLDSRLALERWTGQAPCAVAAPFGLNDARLQHLAAECGYRIGLGTEDGTVSLRCAPFALPRIEVHGDMTLEEFAAVLEASR